MKERASVTALMAAFVRAWHSQRSDEPVFDDFIVRSLFTDDEYRQVGDYIVGGADFFEPVLRGHITDREKIIDRVVNTQLAPTPLARARFCEDALKTALLSGVRQYVILGAGLDTFAWRETGLIRSLRVFEVDHPLTQADKKSRVERAGLSTPLNLNYVPMDFRCDNLREQLAKSGFDETQKTFFGWMGVSFYLSEQDITGLFDNIASFAAEGSTIVFDCADASLFEASEKRVQNMLAMATAGGEPMKFCADEEKLISLLEKSRFLIYEYLSPEDIQCRFFEGREDGLSAFEHISYTLAVLKGAPYIDTKEKILQVALRLFAQNGYEAVSVKDIADKLFITKGALYRHYTSKRDIFDSILERMSCSDAERAEMYGVPQSTPQEMREAYTEVSRESIAQFSRAQFRYWTQESFPSAFRHLLTLEQYRSAEMSSLYSQYFVAGPLLYIEDMFFGMTGDREWAKKAALEFYAPMFFLYCMYDTSENKDEITQLLDNHIINFFNQKGN